MHQQPHGDSHHRSVLTDREVELIRSMYETDRDRPRAERVWSYRALALKFEVSKSTVQHIVGYRRRIGLPVDNGA
jgi:ribosome-binding protein aMBF1 (putative translation factor)